jgi:hypothetical protein
VTLSIPLTLGSATLSGGMLLASAGGGQPQRLTTELDKFYTNTSMGSTSATRNGFAFDPDNLHFWVLVGTTAGANTGFRKIRISDGAVIATVTGNASDGGTRVITSPQGLTRRGNKIYAGNAGAGTYLCEYDMVSNVCRLYAQATVAAPCHVVSDGANLWARTAPTSSSAYQEFTLGGAGDAATATPTARVTAAAFEMVVDNAGTYAYLAVGTLITRYKISDATTTNYTPGLSLNVPGYNGNTFRGCSWDKVEDKLIVRHVNSDDWWYVNSSFNGAEKRAFGVFELGGILAEVGTLFQRSAIAWSDDASMVGFMATESGATATTATNVRIRNLAIQRARWTWTPSTPAVLKSIRIPGELANVQGYMDNLPNPATFFSSIFEFKKTRVYYQVNAGARVEYLGGELAVALAANDVLTVDADMQHLVAHPHAIAPYIAGDGAEGPALTVSFPEPRRRLVGAM